LPVGDCLAHQILAGDAKVDAALAELARDLRRRQESDLDVIAALDPGAVAAFVVGLDDGEAGAGQRFQRLVLEATLGGQRDGDRHAASSMPIRSSQTEKPTPGIGSSAPSKVSSRS